MTPKNGDMPAMPTQYGGGDIYGGLTKREMMAMHAMNGILASLTDDHDLSCGELARCAVRNADALLAELERTK